MTKRAIETLDDDLIEYDDVSPDASAMVESMRAHGYTLPTAIADLIDNSIAAGATTVWIRFDWEEMRSWISVIDDGRGMNEGELINAMRLGSRHPSEERNATDLGRFGLGLKTASFSQARRLTVVTRATSDESFLRRWDLDHLARPDVRGWQLLKTPHKTSGARVRLLDEMGITRGTHVLLESIDRVIADTSRRPQDLENHFLWQINRVREHISMVFHRFIGEGKGQIAIHLNNEPVGPWDPFVRRNVATEKIPEYFEHFDSLPTPIRVTGYVLPHRDRFADAASHKRAGGPRGWNAQQGFYVYRNRRLIIAGDWLQLGWQKEEHFKLARICLDIPNSTDHEWQIDVKKSTASPPPAIRDWLKGIATEVRNRAKEVYGHRGKYGRRKKNPVGHTTPWESTARSDGCFSYRINRKHPLLGALIKSLPSSATPYLTTLLRVIEETVPVQRIWIDTAENQDGLIPPFASASDADLRRIIVACHEALGQFREIDGDDAWALLADFDGFQAPTAQAIIGQLRQEAHD